MDDKVKQENIDLIKTVVRVETKVDNLDKDVRQMNETILSRLQNKEEAGRIFAENAKQNEDHENRIRNMETTIQDVVTRAVTEAKVKSTQLKNWVTIISIIYGVLQIVQFILFFQNVNKP